MGKTTIFWLVLIGAFLVGAQSDNPNRPYKRRKKQEMVYSSSLLTEEVVNTNGMPPSKILVLAPTPVNNTGTSSNINADQAQSNNRNVRYTNKNRQKSETPYSGSLVTQKGTGSYGTSNLLILNPTPINNAATSGNINAGQPNVQFKGGLPTAQSRSTGREKNKSKNSPEGSRSTSLVKTKTGEHAFTSDYILNSASFDNVGTSGNKNEGKSGNKTEGKSGNKNEGKSGNKNAGKSGNKNARTSGKKNAGTSGTNNAVQPNDQFRAELPKAQSRSTGRKKSKNSPEGTHSTSLVKTNTGEYEISSDYILNSAPFDNAGTSANSNTGIPGNNALSFGNTNARTPGNINARRSGNFNAGQYDAQVKGGFPTPTTDIDVLDWPLYTARSGTSQPPPRVSSWQYNNTEYFGN